jgi:glycosylphosphatidylinositol transamidase
MCVSECRTIMMVVGVVWVLALPFEQLGEGTKIDEHALQPGQVSAPRRAFVAVVN